MSTVQINRINFHWLHFPMRSPSANGEFCIFYLAIFVYFVFSAPIRMIFERTEQTNGSVCFRNCPMHIEYVCELRCFVFGPFSTKFTLSLISISNYKSNLNLENREASFKRTTRRVSAMISRTASSDDIHSTYAMIVSFDLLRSIFKHIN